jgi:hypothetical protein
MPDWLNKFVRWVRRWWNKLAIASVISVVAAILILIATGRNGDLIAWTSELTPIYPAEQTKNLPLPLLWIRRPLRP